MQSRQIADPEPQRPKGRIDLGTGQVAQRLQEPRCRVVWSVAGFDPSSGAGITADLMTFASFGLFGCAAITALTVQTTLGVFGTEPVSVEVLRATLERLQQDLPPEGIKIGMLGSVEAAETVAEHLETCRRGDGPWPVVVLDPVLRSSSGRDLFPEEGMDLLQARVLPLVDWITPNWGELALLAGQPVENGATAERAGRELMQRHPQLQIVATGGDQEAPDDLVLLRHGETHRLAGRRVETTATHGTGCAYSSALLAGLVLGEEGLSAALHAKRFVEGALLAAPGIGGGRGPMELLWPLRQGGSR